MGRVLAVMVLAWVASTAWAETSVSAEAPSDAITVRTGLGPWMVPEAGVAWAHRWSERFTVTLAFYGARNIQLATEGVGAPYSGDLTAFTLEPGLRFNLNRAGLFVGVVLPVGYWNNKVFGIHSSALLGGADLQAGLAHVFDGGLTVEVYAGIAGRGIFSNETVSGDTARVMVAAFALRCGLGVGWAF